MWDTKRQKTRFEAVTKNSVPPTLPAPVATFLPIPPPILPLLPSAPLPTTNVDSPTQRSDSPDILIIRFDSSIPDYFNDDNRRR